MTDHYEMPHHRADECSHAGVGKACRPCRARFEARAGRGVVFAAQTNIHRHETGADAVAAATERARNTTIVIGADQERGVLLLDIDVQADVCRDAKELQDQLRLIIEALEGYDPLGDV